MLNNYITF